MASDSEATFSQSVKAKIRETYDYRCAICLNFVRTSQCAHIIDTATAGQRQLLNAAELGILYDDYQRNAETNSMILCPTCHSYFTANYIVLSLPIPVLQYLLKYVSYTHKAKRKPLRECVMPQLETFRTLRRQRSGLQSSSGGFTGDSSRITRH